MRGNPTTPSLPPSDPAPLSDFATHSHFVEHRERPAVLPPSLAAAWAHDRAARGAVAHDCASLPLRYRFAASCASVRLCGVLSGIAWCGAGKVAARCWLGIDVRVGRETLVNLSGQCRTPAPMIERECPY